MKSFLVTRKNLPPVIYEALNFYALSFILGQEAYESNEENEIISVILHNPLADATSGAEVVGRSLLLSGAE